MSKRISFIFFMGLVLGDAAAASLPSLFSKIVITSDKVEGFPVNQDKKCYSLGYKGNVVVTLTDKSTISSDELKVFIHTEKKVDSKEKGATPHKGLVPSAIKTIQFNGNVCIVSEQDTIKANQAEVVTDKNMCLLQGNVQVKHIKKKATDMPAILTSSRASFNFETKEVLFSGDENKPVTTIIHLDKNLTTQRKPIQKAKRDHGKNKNIS